MTTHFQRAMLRVHIRLLLLGLLSLAGIVTGHANNIAVSNVVLTGRNTSAGPNNAANFTLVQFDLSWENSWRVSSGPSNWDAAWVFVKFQVGASHPIFNNVSSTGTTINVSTTANLRVGMPVRVISGTGLFASNTIISSITNATQFVVSAAPTTPLSNASIECTRIWEHAWLNNIGNTANSGTIEPGLLSTGSFDAATNPALGVFIYSSNNHNGNISFANTQLRWNYGRNGVRDDAIINIQVFAIEMVYVPQGSFFVGSGGTESGSFTDGSWTSGNTIPFQITSEAALGIDNVAGKLWGTSSTGSNTIGNVVADPEATLTAAFPKGFAAFYCMKYEVSQGQYRDFLNSLTRRQQLWRTQASGSDVVGQGALSLTNLFRNGIDMASLTQNSDNPFTYGCNLNGNTSFNEPDDGETIACNYLTWMDGVAFADWAALRPMTEMEFEKACRGNLPAALNEYAWGNTSIAGSAYTLGNERTASENIASNYSSTAGNASYNTTDGVINGPLRVGIFATSTSGRVQSGATYYGIMEMSGNLQERTVSLGNTEGRAFTGLHGDGTISSGGHANTSNWPGSINGEVTGALGAGSRGGSYTSGFSSVLYVSDRSNATHPNPANRDESWGFRAVRTVQSQ